MQENSISLSFWRLFALYCTRRLRGIFTEIMALNELIDFSLDLHQVLLSETMPGFVKHTVSGKQLGGKESSLLLRLVNLMRDDCKEISDPLDYR